VTAPRLAGSVCLVTGATGGIGRATAAALARRNARLLLSGRDERTLAEVAAETGGTPVPADLARPGAATSLADRALGVSGRVDVVVHAAGEGRYGPAAALEPEELERLVALNVTSVIELSCALLPGMLERRAGHIVTIGSVAGRLGHRQEAVYSATKAAVSVFSDSLVEELRGTGVSVSLVTPGVVETAFFERRGAAYDRAWPRPVPPEAVAERVVGVLLGPRDEVVVPGLLSVALRFRGALPGVYRALASRFG
jgi:short-subunit dehydrogenase